ncbi:MAG: hypothetical protein ACXWVA_05315 [Rhodoplanes sp.]
MAKTDNIRDLYHLCADSRDLIDQSAVLMSGSGVACAGHKDQIAKSRKAVAKSREQITRTRVKQRLRCAHPRLLDAIERPVLFRGLAQQLLNLVRSDCIDASETASGGAGLVQPDFAIRGHVDRVFRSVIALAGRAIRLHEPEIAMRMVRGAPIKVQIVPQRSAGPLHFFIGQLQAWLENRLDPCDAALKRVAFIERLLNAVAAGKKRVDDV